MNIPNLRYLSSFRSIATALTSFASFLVLSNPATANVAPATGEIGDLVWNDINGNGIQDAGELGISGVVVQLIGLGNLLLATATTDVNGKYLFTNVSAGAYTVLVNLSQPALGGYTATTTGAGTTDTDSNANPAAVSLLLNTSSDLTVDFGFRRPLGLIGNFVWKDMNQDGLQTSGELGVAGVEVRLKNSADSVVATTTTDADGGYQFAGLYAGKYTVEVDTSSAALTGFSATFSGIGSNAAIDSNGSPATVTRVHLRVDARTNSKGNGRTGF